MVSRNLGIKSSSFSLSVLALSSRFDGQVEAADG